MRSALLLLLGFPALLPAGTTSLSYCFDPLVFRDGLEVPYDCSNSETAETTMLELRAALGEPDPIEFCISQQSTDFYSVCNEVCNLETKTGCYGTLAPSELIINASDGLICINYSVHMADIDVTYFGLSSCSLELNGSGLVEITLDSTYFGPLTWGFSNSEAQVSNPDWIFTGCGGLGSLVNLVTSFFSGTITSELESNLNTALATKYGQGICPVDSLHPDLILP